jgi:type I restriction enzyme, S subunit
MKNVFFNEVVDFLEGPGVRNWQFTDSGIKLINIRNLVNDEINLTKTTTHLSIEEVTSKYSFFWGYLGKNSRSKKRTLTLMSKY